MELHPSLQGNFEVCRHDTKRDHDQRRYSKPMREEEYAEPIDAESCDAGRQNGHGIDPPPQPVSGRTLWSCEDRSPNTNSNQARNEMHPSERQKVKVHDAAPGENHHITVSFNPDEVCKGQ